MASSLTKRYGKAILDIAKEKNNTNIWIDNFSNSKEIMNDDDLYSFLSSPQVPNSEKYKSIDTLFKGYEKLFINFLQLLINKGHINYFERVMNEFFDQNQITKKICDVFKVDDVEISENLDKSILGGYIIKVGDTIIDCSTKNKLNGLENHLLRSTTL